MFLQLALFMFSAKEAPNLMDPLDRVIHNQWAPQAQ